MFRRQMQRQHHLDSATLVPGSSDSQELALVFELTFLSFLLNHLLQVILTISPQPKCVSVPMEHDYASQSRLLWTPPQPNHTSVEVLRRDINRKYGLNLSTSPIHT